MQAQNDTRAIVVGALNHPPPSPRAAFLRRSQAAFALAAVQRCRAVMRRYVAAAAGRAGGRAD